MSKLNLAEIFNLTQEEVETKLDDLLEFEDLETEDLLQIKDYYTKQGNAKKTLKTCNLILKANPDNIPVLKEAAEIYYDFGKYQNYERYMLRLIDLDADSHSYYSSLAQYYQSVNRNDEAKVILLQGKKKTENTLFDSLIAQSEKVMEADLQPEVNNSLIMDMLNLFQGRENVHARQWVDHIGRTGYAPVKEPLNYNKMKNHLLGNYTIGVYQLNLENKVKFMAFDIDAVKFTRNEMDDNPAFREVLMKELQKTVSQISAILKENSIPFYLEFSGYKGYHLWIFMDDFISASAARLFCQRVMQNIALTNTPVSVEIFPKQTKITPENMGSLIKIPLGIHQKTGKRSYFCNDSFSPVNQDSFFNQLLLCPPSRLYAVINSLAINTQLSLPDKEPDFPDESLKITSTEKEYDFDNQHNDKNLKELFGSVSTEKKINLDSHSQFQIILSKCYAIKQIVDKITTSFQISNQEKLTIMYTLGHLEDGSEVVNALLKKCLNIPPSDYMKSSFSGNPVSCPKIRSRIKELLDLKKCNCQFSDLMNTYPNPLLHLNAKEENLSISNIDQVKLKMIIDNYLQTKKELNDLTVKFKKQEQEIIKYFEQAGINEIETSIGKLKKVESDGKISFSLEL